MSSTSTHGRKTHDAATAFSAAQASVLVNAVLIGVMFARMGWTLDWKTFMDSFARTTANTAADKRPISGHERAAQTRASSDSEHRDRRFEVARLLMQRRRGRGCLLHERRVLLRHFIHLDDGLIYLLDTRALFKR